MSWAAANRAAQGLKGAVIPCLYGRDRGRRDATVRGRSPTSAPDLHQQPDVQARVDLSINHLGELVDLQPLQQRRADAVAGGRALAGRAEPVLERLDELLIRHAER